MTRTSRIIVAALCTVFVAGGAWAYASGALIGGSNSSSQIPRLVVERKVKKIKVKPKPKKVKAPAAPVSSGTGSYYATASSSAPQVVAPQKQASSVEPEDDSQSGYEDDGGEVEHEGEDD